jgi:hypothetical protein
VNLHNRISKLLAIAQPAARRRCTVAGMLSVESWDVEDILQAITERSSPAGRVILADIDAQAEQWGASDGRTPHGFVLWICDLHDGHGLLPPSVPDDILRAYRDATARRLDRLPAGWQSDRGYGGPVVLPYLRCASCLTLLPSDVPDNWPSARWAECPVCGSPEIERQDWSQPHGVFAPL